MKFSFDLISDLHIETWPPLDWTGLPTSPYCIVAGDVGRDRDQVFQNLKHLGEVYRGGVFYIDGNDEHRQYLEDIGDSYRQLSRYVDRIPNVVFMQDNVVIINGTAIVATNGWWTYDFDSALDYDQSVNWYISRNNLSQSAGDSITGIAINDSAYLINSIRKLQYHQDVKAIVVVTHTVPMPEIIAHDPDLVDTWRFNCMGNKHMTHAIAEDTERKIKVWCFGHYHKSVDRNFDGIRFVNNCRGRGNTDWCQSVYYPKRIEIEF